MLGRADAPLSCPTAGRYARRFAKGWQNLRRQTGRRLEFRVARAPQALQVVLLASRAYYQWPVDKSRRAEEQKSRRAEEKSVGCHLGSGSMVAHDSDDVTALGDFFQISIPVAILSVDLDECILAPNSFRLLLILVDMPDK